MRSRLNLVMNWAELAAAANYQAELLARRCRVSPRHLERFFLETFGKSPHLWMTGLRQTQALTLLSDRLSVKEVAGRLGYKQPAHFSREFKRFHGVAPTAIQELFLENVAFRYEMSHLDTPFRFAAAR